MVLDKVLEKVRATAAGVVAPAAEAVDASGDWPEASIRALQGIGLGGLVVPRRYGGHQLGLFGLARVCEELGKHCPSTALCFGMHCVGSAVIAAKASVAQAESFLEPISKGEHLTTLALSEPGSGSHFYFPETALLASESGYVLNGQKSFVTNGGFADSYVVSAIGKGDVELGEFSCLIVPSESGGLEWAEKWAGLGMRGNSSRGVRLRDVHLAHDCLLGAEGDQLWYVFNVIAPYFLVAMAGTYLGVGRAALEMAVSHLKARSYAHSGSALAEAPVIQHKLGKLWGRLEAGAQLVYYAAREGDVGGPDSTLALFAAKSEISEIAVDAVNDCMTLMGGAAYASGSPIGRMLRDVRAAHVMAPTTDLLRLWSGRLQLGEPVLAE